MNPSSSQFARTQADGLDNIAPTLQQGQAAWQYALTDGFLSSEEQAAVLRRQLETHRTAIEQKLATVGITRQVLTENPRLEQDLFSGRRTDLVAIRLPNDLQLEGRLRIVMTDSGPDVRITSAHRQLQLPGQVEGFKLTDAEREELRRNGSVQRPLMVPDNGSYLPAYLRVDPLTNTVDLWRVREQMLPIKLLGVDLTRDQQLQLASGHPIRLAGLKDAQGEPFNATVSVSAARQSLQFSDISRQDVAVRPDPQFKEQVAQNNQGAKTDQTRHQEAASGHRGSGLQTVSNAQKETIQRLMIPDPDVKQTPKQRPI